MALSAARSTAAIAIIAALTFLFYLLLPVNSTTVALSFLLAILALGTFWGLPEAISASVAGMLAFNYFFLPPIGTFTIADPQNWVALGSFLTTAIVASQLSATVKHRALEAEQRGQEMERLYALSRAFLLQESDAGKVCAQIAQVFDLPAAALYDRGTDRVFHGGVEEMTVDDGKLRDAAVQATEWHDPASGVRLIPVSLGREPMASLAVPGGLISDAALHSIANLTAIILERARAQELAYRAEAARRNEQLKSTLLDALAHELKTPLTAIKAAVSGPPGNAAEVAELLEIVDEETDRLTQLVTEAIQMARIDAGNIRLESQPWEPSELIAEAVDKLGAAGRDREIQVDAPPTLPKVLADRDLAALAIRQLVNNSLKFAAADSPVTVRALDSGSTVTFRVIDRGPGIPEREQARVFEKFYRVPDRAALIPGTGMGLTIVKGIVEAHEGHIWLVSRPGEGTEISFTLPKA